MPILPEITERALAAARAADHGRHAELLVSDGPLRQTVIALRAGTQLAEHNSPPAASILVLSGSIRVTGERPAQLDAGDLEALTHQRHAVEALSDAAFLLTAVTDQAGIDSHGESA